MNARTASTIATAHSSKTICRPGGGTSARILAGFGRLPKTLVDGYSKATVEGNRRDQGLARPNVIILRQ
jgi:hypothetical protein